MKSGDLRTPGEPLRGVPGLMFGERGTPGSLRGDHLFPRSVLQPEGHGCPRVCTLSCGSSVNPGPWGWRCSSLVTPEPTLPCRHHTCPGNSPPCLSFHHHSSASLVHWATQSGFWTKALSIRVTSFSHQAHGLSKQKANILSFSRRETKCRITCCLVALRFVLGVICKLNVISFSIF